MRIVESKIFIMFDVFAASWNTPFYVICYQEDGENDEGRCMECVSIYRRCSTRALWYNAVQKYGEPSIKMPFISSFIGSNYLHRYLIGLSDDILNDTGFGELLFVPYLFFLLSKQRY